MRTRNRGEGRPDRSDALEAFRIKDAEVRARLSRGFIGYAKLPFYKNRKKCLMIDGERATGFVVIATDGVFGAMATETYAAYLVGAPDEHVQEAKDIIWSTWEAVANRFSPLDVHAVHPVGVLSNYARALLEDKYEPRALGVESIFIEMSGRIYWGAYNGAHGDENLVTPKRKVFIRGCYDMDVRRKVELHLMNRLLKTEEQIDKAYLRQIARETKKLTGVKKVTIVTMGGNATCGCT